MRTRTRLLGVTTALAVVFCSVGVASAGVSQPPPRAGTWKFADGPAGGFSLVKAGHKLLLANVHGVTQNFSGCPEKPERITVSGRFRLKLLALAGFPGYRAWGVGKTGEETRYSDSNTGIVSIPAKVRVAGKLVENGAIKMDFSSTEANTFEILIIEFGPSDRPPCVTYSLSAHHA